MPKTRRGTSTRAGKWQGWKTLYGLDSSGKKTKSFYQVQQTPLVLMAGDRGNIVPVSKDLSWYDANCPRAVGKYPLVPEPERTPVFR